MTTLLETPFNATRLNPNIDDLPPSALASPSSWLFDNGGVSFSRSQVGSPSLSSGYTFESWLAASEYLKTVRDSQLASQKPAIFDMMGQSLNGTVNTSSLNTDEQVASQAEQSEHSIATSQPQYEENTSISSGSTTSLRFSGLKPNADDMFIKDVTVTSAPEYKIKTDYRGYATITMKINEGHVYWGQVWAEKDKTKGGFYKVYLFLGFKSAKKGSKDYTVSAMPGSLVNSQQPNARLGSWVGRNPGNKNQVHLANAASATMLTPMFNWTRNISHISQLALAVEDGSRTKIDAMKDHYTIWYKGKRFLSDLGKVVEDGSLYSKDTFYNALDRLKSAIRFDDIVKFIRDEAASPVDPVIRARDSTIYGLTNGTAAFRGFLQFHPEVNGNKPIPIVKQKRIIKYDKTFSLWVRETMISLNYTLDGQFAKAVKILLKKVATEGSLLGFLIDGQNDAWDPKARRVKGRELQERDDQLPTDFPILDYEVANTYTPTDNGETAGQLLAQIRGGGMAAAVATTTAEAAREHGTTYVLHGQVPITADARLESDTAFLGLIERFLATPGVLVTGTMPGQDGRDIPLTRAVIEIILFNGRAGERFDQRLYEYYHHPADNREYQNMRQMFAHGHLENPVPSFDDLLLAAVVRGRITSFRILEEGPAMRLLNTLIIGNMVTQGFRFAADPWRQLVDEEVRGIRRRQQNRTPYERYIGNANIQRFTANRDSLIPFIRQLVLRSLPPP